MTSSQSRKRFDAAADLPRGRLAIEASAGTGKTYALSTLAARYVAEAGVEIEKILLVTFTKAAAAELRARVRQRLVEFDGWLSAEPIDTNDPVRRRLTDVGEDERRERQTRTSQALSTFDTASITTIHGFAKQALATLGSAGGVDVDAELVDLGGLIEQAAADLLAAEAIEEVEHDDDDTQENPTVASDKSYSAGTELNVLRNAARTILGNPRSQTAAIETDPTGELFTDVARRLALVHQIGFEVARRRRSRGTMSFDDLLGVLWETVDPEHGESTVLEQIADRFPVVLIDEFQDTDPLQWQIFDAIFGHGDKRGHDGPGSPRALVLVGDPKQAIYSFRGANIHTYLSALDDSERQNLDTNWRSDAAVVEALEALLTGVEFGTSEIAFQPVTARHTERRLATTATADDSTVPGLVMRLVDPESRDVKNDTDHKTPKRTGSDAVWDDVAHYIGHLLDTAVVTAGDSDDGSTQPLRPEDIAVLTRTRFNGNKVRDALQRRGIPAVAGEGTTVLESVAAQHWHVLLRALALSSNPRRARAVALGWFGPRSGTDALDDERLVQTQIEMIDTWKRILHTFGVAEFVRRVWNDSHIAERVAKMDRGDRHLTDLDHIAELLIVNAPRRPSGAGLLRVFGELDDVGAQRGPNVGITSRRVASDSGAVQVMTIHGSKGLEFPVVCCPDLFDSSQKASASTKGGTAHSPMWSPLVWWDGDSQVRKIDPAFDLTGRQTKDGAWTDARAGERADAADREWLGEVLRLLYVALTRSEYQTALWWHGTKKARVSGLSRVLFGREGGEGSGFVEDAFDPGADFGPHAGPQESAGAPEVLLAARDEVRAVLASAGATAAVHAVGLDDDPLASPTRTDDRRAATAESDPSDAGVTDPEGDDGLAVATFEAALPRTARRWSYTAITKTMTDEAFDDTRLDESGGDARAADEPTEDHSSDSTPPAEVAADLGATEVPLSSQPAGAEFGTMVHAVFEHTDFTSANLAEHVRQVVGQQLGSAQTSLRLGELSIGLAAAMETPLGPLLNGRPLASLASSDRLDELAFDFTLGSEGNDPPTLAQLVEVVRTHSADSGDVIARWVAHLDERGHRKLDQRLGWYLTGSIDLIARVRAADDPEDVGRFVVCDYKTNRIALSGEPATNATYGPERLVSEMLSHDYPLQMLLYSVAMHRYLRWRLPGYDPAVHLGDVGYLFIRGMAGPATPVGDDGVPHGVCQWHPNIALIEELSALLAGRTPPATGSQQ